MLFDMVGFPRRNVEKMEKALANTHRLIWIRATKATRFQKLGQCVGFARATSDGHLVATIWDVAVLPVLQKRGLGSALIERLLQRLVDDDIPLIALYAEPGVVKLYRVGPWVLEYV